MMDVVKFRVDETLQTALKFDTGRPCQSKYSGDQVAYTLHDDRVMFVSPAVAAQIEELGIRRFDPFSITLREQRVGNRKTQRWEIARLDVDVPDEEEAPPIKTEPSPRAVASGALSSAVNAHGQNHSNVASNGNGNGAVPPVNGNGNGLTAYGDLLTRMGVLVIDAVLAVEQHAHARGMEGFTFGADNIQKILATMLISTQRNGGRA